MILIGGCPKGWSDVSYENQVERVVFNVWGWNGLFRTVRSITTNVSSFRMADYDSFKISEITGLRWKNVIEKCRNLGKHAMLP